MRGLRPQTIAVLLALSILCILASCSSSSVVSDQSLEETAAAADAVAPVNPLATGLAEVFSGWKEPTADLPPTDRQLAAGDYEPSLPHARVSGATRLTFMPDGEEYAYCFYVMQLAGYEESLNSTLDWHLWPDWPDTWICVADYTQGMWRWQNVDSYGPYYLGEPEDVISPEGNVIFGVLVMGTFAAELDYVRIGTNEPPELSFWVDPLEGPAGEVYLNAWGDDPENEDLHYEFDLDGDGVYETDNGDSRYLLIELLEPGEYPISVRVTDDAGAFTTATELVTINDWTAETIAYADYYGNFSVVQDADAHNHLTYYEDLTVPPWFYLSYASDVSGSWEVETVSTSMCISFASPCIAIDSTGVPWIVFADMLPDEWQMTIRFFSRTGGVWTERPDLAFKSEFSLNMLSFYLDSADHLHVIDGCDGHHEGNGAFSYHYHDGSDWVDALSWVPATQAVLRLTTDDQPVIMYYHDDLKAILVAQRSGGGWGFRIEHEFSWLNAMVLDSDGYICALYELADYTEWYEPMGTALIYDWRAVYHVPEQYQAGSSIDSDLCLTTANEPRILLEWDYYSYGDDSFNKWAIARPQSYKFDLEWFRQGGETRCMHILLDADGREMVFSSHVTEIMEGETRRSFNRIILSRPPE